jgi:hypothetical protein
MNTTTLPCSSSRIQAAKARLAAQGAAIAVVATAALAPATAEAADIVSIFTPGAPVDSAPSNFISFDPEALFTAPGYDTAPIGLRVCSINIAYDSAEIQFLSLATTILPWDETNTPFTFPTLLPGGTAIGASGTYATSGSFAAASDGTYIDPYAPIVLTNQYLGYRILSDFAPGGYNYGWVNFDYDAVSSTITLNQWAVRLDGQPLVVPSAIPEPASFATLAGVALLGFTITTRRRRAA